MMVADSVMIPLKDTNRFTKLSPDHGLLDYPQWADFRFQVSLGQRGATQPFYVRIWSRAGFLHEFKILGAKWHSSRSLSPSFLPCFFTAGGFISSEICCICGFLETMWKTAWDISVIRSSI